LVADPEWRIGINEFSWHNAPAWVVYLDQPVGTGLSFTRDGRYCRNDEEVNEDFYAFLVNFLKVYSDMFLTTGNESTSRKVFFAGESHAGHYIPSIMDYILKKNEEDAEIYIELGGAAIGNGWVDPYNQYAAAAAAYGTGLIDLAQWADLNRKEKECQKQMDDGTLNANICFSLLDSIITDSNGWQKYKVSVYDNRVWELLTEPRSFPKGHKIVEAFLGNVKENKQQHPSNPKMPDATSQLVLIAIHATEATHAGQFYKECTDPPYDALVHQDGKGVVPELVRVLSHPDQIPVLFFNGMNDLMCNHASNERFLDLLPWDHAKDFTLAKRFVWNGVNKDNLPAGYVKQHRNLILLKIRDSGHMVPMDQPELSLQMMRTFLFANSFQDKPQSNLGTLLPANQEQCQKCPDTSDCTPTKTELPESDYGNVKTSFKGGFQEKTETRQTPNEDPAQRFVIAGAWMGALMASFALAYYKFYIQRRLSTVPFDQLEMKASS